MRDILRVFSQIVLLCICYLASLYMVDNSNVRVDAVIIALLLYIVVPLKSIWDRG